MLDRQTVIIEQTDSHNRKTDGQTDIIERQKDRHNRTDRQTQTKWLVNSNTNLLLDFPELFFVLS